MKHAHCAQMILAFLLCSNNSQASVSAEDLTLLGGNVNNSFVQHSIKKTDRSWDLAITGNGFFPLQDRDTGETFYTRLGHFEMDRDGYVILSGHPKLRLLMRTKGRDEAVNMLPWVRHSGFEMVGLSFDDEKEIGTLEAIYGNGDAIEIARVLLAEFFNNGKIVAVESNIYKATDAALPHILARPTEKGLGRVASKSLEQL